MDGLGKKDWTMERPMTIDIKQYLYMTERYVNKNHMLDFILPISKAKFKEKEVKVLVLINKYFPSYKLKQFDIERNWEDFILYNKKYKLDWGINHVYLQLPFFYNIEADTHITNISENGASICIEVGHNDQQVCIITFRPNVFTNINFIDMYEEGKGWYRIWVDQSKSATINRKTLSDFLIELEQILDTEIIETASSYINKKYLYKYGIKEEAELEL